MEWHNWGAWCWELTYPEDANKPFFYIARVELRLGKWSVEIWRKHRDQWGWEFIDRFWSVEEAKNVAYTIARIETN